MEDTQWKLARAQTQVKRIKYFYAHSFIFLFIMSIIGVLAIFGHRICIICFTKNVFLNILGFAPWLLFIVVQGLIAFKKITFFSKWEERKIKEFMED